MNFTQKDIEESRTAEIRGRYDWFASDDAVTDTGYRVAAWTVILTAIGFIIAFAGERYGLWELS